VDVEVAEEDLLRVGHPDALGSASVGAGTARYHRWRSARLRYLAGLLVASEPPAPGAPDHQREQHQETYQNDDHSFEHDPSSPP
jgi:hypothetical protein